MSDLFAKTNDAFDAVAGKVKTDRPHRMRISDAIVDENTLTIRLDLAELAREARPGSGQRKTSHGIALAIEFVRGGVTYVLSAPWVSLRRL